jgi:hypothetical protein
MSGTSDIRGWLAEELAHAGPRRKTQLAKLAEHLRKAEQHQHANALPVGSFQRQIARIHERKMVAEAMHLGFHPPEEDLKELGLHVAGQSLGLSL